MNRLTKYLNDTAAEMKHVKWPTSRQTIIYTLLVIAISALTAFFVAAFDYVFTNTLNSLI
jgi:preprotein translocase subunit SecE